MSILKAAPKHPKTTVVQLRLDEEAKLKLATHAEFLDCSPSYVVTEALKLVCTKDKEFQAWLSGQHASNPGPNTKGESLPLQLQPMRRRLQFGVREDPASDRRHGSRLAIGTVAKENCITDNSLALSQVSPASAQSAGNTRSSGPHFGSGEGGQIIWQGIP